MIFNKFMFMHAFYIFIQVICIDIHSLPKQKNLLKWFWMTTMLQAFTILILYTQK